MAEAKTKTYLTIVEIETNKTVKLIDVTGSSESMKERTERGLLMKTNLDRFFVGEATEEKLLETLTLEEIKQLQ